MALSNKANARAETAWLGRAVKFIKEARIELRKVIWPNRKQLITYTGVVIATVAVISIFVGIVDFLFLQFFGLLGKLGR